jgi:hypothetical protein
MDLDPDVVASLVVPYQPRAYLRVTPIAHRTTPLGMGFGKTRFASPTDAFKLLYIAEDLATGLAEAVIRDRFEGATVRELTAGELAGLKSNELSFISRSKASELSGKSADRRKLMAVLFADMVGYSGLIGLDDSGILQR